MDKHRYLLAACAVCFGGSVLCAYFGLFQEPEGFVAIPLTLDMGDLQQMQIADGEFIMLNNYRQPIEITNITQSCGCSKAEMDKKVVEAGGRSKLTAQWNTGAARGYHNVQIGITYRLVETNDTGWFALTMRGNIIPEIEHEPKELAFNERVPSKKVISFRSKSLGSSLVIDRPYTSHRAFKVTLSGKHEVTVEFDPTEWKSTNAFSPHLGIRTNGSKEQVIRLDLDVIKSTPSCQD